MAGQPQLREAAWLYAPGDAFVPVAVVRLVERMDGTGVWQVLMNSPAEHQEPKVWERPDKRAARAVLDDLYAEGRDKGGRWKVTQYGEQ
ncbi:hypothetical protein OG992_18625 [Micromonospora sp. NBC_00362]|uniref:hypothetical protein n=1 Tax=Micromonospora sp. NBC_00362 TaxID=2975975 RepID=UPI00225197BA|nr:hypothetical protein [Micromonospora sp. NBC_00362]MCX5119204.1 hypothetical protein [Micromonospora sp. NBC_00362]